MAQFILVFLLVTVSLFMILLILIQRGKGGGLAGAFGGMGGQSAFGTKAGDMFTKITICTALIWFSLCVGTVWFLNNPGLLSGGGLNVETDQRRTTPAPLEGVPAPGTATSSPDEGN